MNNGYVYFIQRERDELIKIGFSTNIAVRLGNIRTSVRSSIVLLGMIKGDLGLEASLHRHFSQHLREGREWFSPVQEILELVEAASYIPLDYVGKVPLFRCWDESIPKGYHRCPYCGDVKPNAEFKSNGKERNQYYAICLECMTGFTRYGRVTPKINALSN